MHFAYPDRTELVEEYDITTYELLARRWKKPKEFGKEEWVCEIGDSGPSFNPDADLLAPSSSSVCGDIGDQ